MNHSAGLLEYLSVGKLHSLVSLDKLVVDEIGTRNTAQ